MQTTDPIIGQRMFYEFRSTTKFKQCWKDGAVAGKATLVHEHPLLRVAKALIGRATKMLSQAEPATVLTFAPPETETTSLAIRTLQVN